jgi:hypothetical protein
VRRLSVEARRDPRSVRNVVDGRAKAVVALSVREAADRLGIDLPTPTDEEEPSVGKASARRKAATR